jgi:hypothetical protein
VPGSPAKTRKLPARRVLIAGSIVVLVVAAMGWTANRVWSTWRQPATPEVALVEDIDVSDAVPDLHLPQPPSAVEVKPEAEAPEARLTSSLREEDESVAGEWSQMPPKTQKVDGTKGAPQASSGSLVVKHRREFSEEDLRKQLLWAPEVGLRSKDVPCVFSSFKHELLFGNDDRTYSPFDPNYILAERADLKTLPYRRGYAKRIDANAAQELRDLGQELHLLLERFAPRTGQQRTSTVLLSQFMDLETRDGKVSAWLRPEAVPTLQQILGHEDLPVRLLLVDLLSRIDGRAASLALAQHAVFDLSADVREAAIRALDRRPREQYRSALVSAFRYPWAPAADHAGEALSALKDIGAAPLLVALLKERDPAVPVMRNEHLWKREVVRLGHFDNCLACHPPALTDRDPVPGIVPGFALVEGNCGRAVVATSPSTASASKQSDYSDLKGAASLLVRGDITYLRQDFSIQQPVQLQSGKTRFDYLVRFRPLTTKESNEWKALKNRPTDYEQREAVLFALRELTGQDAGPTTEAWQTLYPTSEFEKWTNKLTMALVDAPDLQKAAVIAKLRDAKGVAYTEALVQAIPQLAETYQSKARAALVERMKRMSRATLRDKLSSDNAEIRLAAVTAVGFKEESALASDLEALLDDPEPAVAEAAQKALKSLKVREAKAGDGAE